MGVIELLKKGMNIGVPAGMPPEEARTIRFLNIFMLISFTVGLLLLLYGVLWFVLLKNIIPPSQTFLPTPVQQILWMLLWNTVYFAILFMNHRGWYQLARNILLISLNLLLLIESFYFHVGKGTREHLLLILGIALAAVIYPKKNSLVMYFMIAISIIFLTVVEFFGPEYAVVSQESIAIDFQLLFCLTILLLVARYSTNSAEDRLLESQKKIAALSEKLKVYLPHQFVEDLADGDREAVPDYKRKKLTVFFSDVKGFTAWTDKLQPEDTRNILNQYLSEMNIIADKWGGTVDKFIGDAIMIFFGDPEYTNDRDHALRCVKMAIDMQDRMAELRREWENEGYEEPLRIRIGVNTGYATVGNFGSEGRLNYTALGSTVNLASRLETACTPDKITVSHMTYSLVKDEIECESKGTIDAKGFPEPVKIYEVVGKK